MLKGDTLKISVLKGVFISVLAFICVFSHMHSASAHGKHANASKETVTASKAGNSQQSREQPKRYTRICTARKSTLGSPGSARTKP